MSHVHTFTVDEQHVEFDELFLELCHVLRCLTSASLLEAKGLQNVVKSLVLAELWQFHMHACSQSCSEVRGTCEDKSEVLVPHEGFALLFDGVFDFLEAFAESVKHSFHVSAFLHGDDTSVVFFVHLREGKREGGEGERDHGEGGRDHGEGGREG